MPVLNGTPLVNGIRHSYASVELVMLGRTVTGVSEIKYGDDVDIEDNRGAGNYAISRGYGDYTPTCSLKLEKYELEALQAAAGGLRIQEIPLFDLVVAFKPIGSDLLVTDVIRNCTLKSNIRDMKTGDKMISSSIDVVTSHILWFGMTE